MQLSARHASLIQRGCGFMRDDRTKWDRLSSDIAVELARGTTLRRVNGLQLTMISGPSVLSSFDVFDVSLVGWPEVASEDRYAVTMRRDRVLLVGACDLEDGWHADRNLAVSDISHGYAVFELSGEATIGLLKQGTEIDLDRPSKSVVRLAFGLGLHIYRYGNESTFRIHVLSHQSEALIGFLKSTK